MATRFIGIYPHRAEFIKSLFDDHIVQEMMEKELLIGTCLTEKKLDGFGLVLKHDPAQVFARPKEWSVITYLEAAKSYLILFHELQRRGLTLVDGHWSNFPWLQGGE
jgi:hypothetical protein